MVNWISSWAGNIVIVVIISTILEMIIPDGNNKKYIKTIVGIFILFNIIGPVITKITGEEINLDNINQIINVESTNAKDVIALNTDASIREVYLDNLKFDLESKIKEKGYIAKDISISIKQDDKDNYGKINDISFKIIKNTTNEIEDNKIQAINEINISINCAEKEEIEQTEEISSKEYKEIQIYISNLYGVDIENVNVY